RPPAGINDGAGAFAPAAVYLLKIQLRADLQNALASGADAVFRSETETPAGAAELRREIDDLGAGAHRAERACGVGGSPFRAFEGVVCFQAKLDVRPLFDCDVLEQAHVPVLQAGAAQAVIAGVEPDAPLGGGREAIRIDERVDIAIPARLVGITRQDHA